MSKTNTEPEHAHLEKEKHRSKPSIFGFQVSFSGVYKFWEFNLFTCLTNSNKSLKHPRPNSPSHQKFRGGGVREAYFGMISCLWIINYNIIAQLQSIYLRSLQSSSQSYLRLVWIYSNLIFEGQTMIYWKCFWFCWYTRYGGKSCICKQLLYFSSLENPRFSWPPEYGGSSWIFRF